MTTCLVKEIVREDGGRIGIVHVVEIGKNDKGERQIG